MEATEVLDSIHYENNIYQVRHMSLEETEEKFNGIRVLLNANRKFHV